MSLKSNISFVFLFCFLGKVILSNCQLVLVVNRNVIDSFLVGNVGCRVDPDICPRSSTCHSKSGLCLCSSGKPTYRDPVIKTDDAIGLEYGSSYGCVNNLFIDGYGSVFCPFSPFQVIHYTHNAPATKFSYDDPNVALKSCSLRKAWAKFPGSPNEIEQKWLNESSVDLKVSSNSLYFKWKRSVPRLQGTIIRFNLRCDVGSSILELNCLRAKVLGTRLSVKPSTCPVAYWGSSFDYAGWSKCGKDNLFITGFYRSGSKDANDEIFHLEQAKCCSSILWLSGQSGECKIADWSSSLDSNNQWSLCPPGYFLNGLNRTGGHGNLHNIEEGHCCRPKYRPDHYGLCYDKDVAISFDQTGWSSCSEVEGYYITGVYRGPGEDGLSNIDKFRCCQMAKDDISVPTLTPTQPKKKTESADEESSNSIDSNTVLIAVLSIALVFIVVLGIVVGFLWKKMQRTQDKKIREMQSIPEQREANSGNEVVIDGGIQNCGASFPSSEHDNNNAELTDHDDYAVPSNYQPLKRNNLRSER